MDSGRWHVDDPLVFLLHTVRTEGNQGLFPNDSLCPHVSYFIFHGFRLVEPCKSTADLVWRGRFCWRGLDGNGATIREECPLTGEGQCNVGAHMRVILQSAAGAPKGVLREGVAPVLWALLPSVLDKAFKGEL
jgi:hypothetical protein